MLRSIRFLTKFAAIVVAVIAVGIAFFLLLAGQSPDIVVSGPQPAAIITILSSGLIILGVITSHRVIAWTGVAILFLSGAILIAGIGSLLILLAVVQALLLALLQSAGRRAQE
jgi:hypothetical protein